MRATVLLRLRAPSAILASIAALSLCASTATAAPRATAAGWKLEPAGRGFSSPTGLARMDDGSLAVAEQAGRVLLRRAGKSAFARLLDIGDHVNRIGERGLTGIAFAPRASWRKATLYLLYAYDPPGGEGDQPGRRTARLTSVRIRDGRVRGRERTILGSASARTCRGTRYPVDCLASDGMVHSVGSVRVDRDGTLWVGLGDGQTGNPAEHIALRAQDIRSANGKLLHVRPNGRGLASHPFCPSERDLRKTCTKVAAIGFRNPWRFQLDGDKLIVGDVGEAEVEELDHVTVGDNYGWPCREGELPGLEASQPVCNGLTSAPSVWSYRHEPRGATAIIAGPRLPSPWGALAGQVLAGDYGLAQAWLLNPNTMPWTAQEIARDVRPVDFALDGTTAYLLDFGTGPRAGRLWRLTAAGA